MLLLLYILMQNGFFIGQLGSIKNMSIASILCLTSGIGDITQNVFRLPTKGYIPIYFFYPKIFSKFLYEMNYYQESIQVEIL